MLLSLSAVLVSLASASTVVAPPTDSGRLNTAPMAAAKAAPLALPAPDAKTDGLALNRTYAGGAGDALQICCMATWCTTSVIEDCDLLSPAGKVFAGGTALVGGLVGFGVGYGAALLLTSNDGDYIVLLPLGDVVNADAESYATLGLLGGAFGVMVGGGIGLVSALLVEPWVQFFFAARTPRTPRRPGTPEFPSTPDDNAPGSAPPRP